MQERFDLDNTREVKDTYANTVRVEATVYDIALKFGVMSEGVDHHEVTVRMSPQHAKSVLILLERFLASYENEVGRILLPEVLERRLRGEESNASPDSKS